MTPFAKKVLRKLGAVPTYEYDQLNYAYREHTQYLYNQIEKISRQYSLATVINPTFDVKLNEAVPMLQVRHLRVKSLGMNVTIDDSTLLKFQDNKEYAEMVAEQVAHKYQSAAKKAVYDAVNEALAR